MGTRRRRQRQEELWYRGDLAEAPGMYFRVMLIGFFEGIESERGIAWRVADSCACGSSCRSAR
jgi:hypothetical protein